MNKYVKALIETLAFNPASLANNSPRKKMDQSVISDTYYTYKPKTEKELKQILRDHINRKNYDFSDITLYFMDMPENGTLFNNKLLNDIDLETLKEYCFEYRPKTNKELRNTIYNLYNFNHINDLNCIDVSMIEDFSNAFEKVKSLNKVDIQYWDVSNGKNFTDMFDNCYSLHCDLSNWDVSNGRIFRGMFNKCTELNIDVSKWDVSNGEDFAYMFANSNFNCDLSNWDVSNGRNFYGMFRCCFAFNCDLSNWDVSNAVSRKDMFLSCFKFNSDFSNWDVSNVKSFNGTFCNCGSLKSDFSRWDVSNGIDFRWMFSNCSMLNCDLSGWDVSNGIQFDSMFSRCVSMKMDIRSWNMENARRAPQFVNEAPGIISNVSDELNSNIVIVIDKDDLIDEINDCIDNEYYDLNDIDVSLIKDFSYLFKNLASVKRLKDKWDETHDKDDDEYIPDFKLDISNWDMSNAENLSHMFDDIDFVNFNTDGFKNWDVSNVKDFSYMFANQYNTNPPERLNLENWDVSNGEDFSNMFNEFYQILDFDFGAWDVGNGRNFENMFKNSGFWNLPNVTKQVDNWKIRKDANIKNMFKAIAKNVRNEIERYPVWYDKDVNEE